MKTQFKINHGPVVFENYNDEVVAINLDCGVYYSLIGASSQAWNLILAHYSVEQMSAHFITALEGDPTFIASELGAFLRRLEEAQLIVADACTDSTLDSSITQVVIEKKLFAGFEMMVYTDMQDLLLLDPVHDVDDSGWPTTASEDSIN